MVDGYGDGLVIECGTEDVDYLRTTSFGLLQVRTVCAGCTGCAVRGDNVMGHAFAHGWLGAWRTVALLQVPLSLLPRYHSLHARRF